MFLEFTTFDLIPFVRFLIIAYILNINLCMSQIIVEAKYSERLAKQACGKCHAFPLPESMFREDWEKGAFPYLEDLLGLDELSNYDETTQEDVRKRWEFIKSYYLTNSRKKTPVASFKQSTDSLFGHRNSSWGLDVTAIHHNPELGLVFVGDAKSRSVKVYDQSLQLVKTFEADKVPCDFELIGDRLYVCSHQSLDPIDDNSGEVGFITDSGQGEYQPILKGLNRPTRYVPFDHSGENYAVLCEFGIRKGKITLYRSGESHLVISMSGAIDCRVLDADSDGQPEVYILVAQEHECLIRLTLSPSGTVDQKLLIKKHPGWGFTAMAMLDVEGDGSIDILLSNGDTTEFRSNPRGYHGIRHYDFDQDELVERQFIPAHGVMDFTVLDAEGDGDLDIASVSYFADFRNKPQQAAMLHRRDGSEFVSQTLAGYAQGNWCRIESGDIDGDGDPDLFLGALNYQTVKRGYENDDSYLRLLETPDEFIKKWEHNGNHLRVLENRIKGE